MKFSTLLKSNKLQGWEDFYIQYDLLIKYLKSDPLKFKNLLINENTKITTFFNEIEEQANQQKNELLMLVKNNLLHDTNRFKNFKEKVQQNELIEDISKIITSIDKNNKMPFELGEYTDFEFSDFERKNEFADQTEISFGGEESDFECVNLIDKNEQNNSNVNLNNEKLNVKFIGEAFKDGKILDSENVSQLSIDEFHRERSGYKNVPYMKNRENFSTSQENINKSRKFINTSQENLNKSNDYINKDNDHINKSREHINRTRENVKINNTEKKAQKKRSFNFLFSFNTFENRKKEKAFHEILQAINSVKSFRDINYMGMTILIRKYKIKYGADEFSSSFLKKLHRSHFGKSKKIDNMQKDIRFVYKKVFNLDDKSQANNIFKRIGKKVKSDPWLCFIAGVLVSIFCFIFYNIDFSKNENVKCVAYLIGLIHLGFFCFGLCNILFSVYNINYDLIFNFDVISKLSPERLIVYSTALANATFIACYFFIVTNQKFVNYFIVAGNLLIAFLPIDVLCYNSRLYLISVFFGTMISGFRKVYFKNFFFADVFNSYTPCFRKIIFELGIKKSTTSLFLINLFFPSLRMIQCLNRYKETNAKFPHLLNFTKYALVACTCIIQTYSLINKEPAMWRLKIVLCFCSASYSLIWDFFLDWTIFRNKKCFPKYFYCVGSIYNIVCRYIWMVKEFGIFQNEYTFISLEVVRRFVWALFRVENEHVNNCCGDESKFGLLFSKELFFIKDSSEYKNINVDRGERV